MHRLTFAALVAFTVAAALLHAKPDRPAITQPEPKPPAIPVLVTNTNWGVLTQTGRKFTIYGHECWEATGEIRKDGSVLVLWYNYDRARFAPGVYTIKKDGEMHGEWNFDSDAEIDENGKIVGRTVSDWIYRVKANEPAEGME